MVASTSTLCGDSCGQCTKTGDFLRFLRFARDSLRRFVWSMCKNWGLFTVSAVRTRPSAEIRVVDVQKLGTFYDFCGSRANLCGDSRGRCTKTGDFLRFLRFARDPLRRFVWSMYKNWGLFTISAVRARTSAEIRVVDVQKLVTFYDFCGSRATLCGDSCGRCTKTGDFLRFLRFAREPLRRFVWSMCKNWGLFTISAVRARPSAEIRVVDVQKLGTFYDFCGSRATAHSHSQSLTLTHTHSHALTPIHTHTHTQSL